MASACFPTLALRISLLGSKKPHLMPNLLTIPEQRVTPPMQELPVCVVLEPSGVFFFGFVQRLGDGENGIHSVVHGCVDIQCHR